MFVLVVLVATIVSSVVRFTKVVSASVVELVLVVEVDVVVIVVEVLVLVLVVLV